MERQRPRWHKNITGSEAALKKITTTPLQFRAASPPIILQSQRGRWRSKFAAGQCASPLELHYIPAKQQGDLCINFTLCPLK